MSYYCGQKKRDNILTEKLYDLLTAIQKSIPPIIVSVGYLLLCIYLREKHFKGNYLNNWMGTLNSIITISLLSGTVLFFLILIINIHANNGYESFVYGLLGGIFGFVIGLIISLGTSLKDSFKEKSILYYIAPIIVILFSILILVNIWYKYIKEINYG